jgi:hypothetical protein
MIANSTSKTRTFVMLESYGREPVLQYQHHCRVVWNGGVSEVECTAVLSVAAPPAQFHARWAQIGRELAGGLAIHPMPLRAPKLFFP